MSEWKNFSLGEVCNFSKDKVAVSMLNLGNYISTENLLPNKGGVTEAASLPKVVTTTSFNVGDILISNIRPYFKKIWRATFSGGCSNDVLVIRAKKNIEPKFLYYVLSEDKFFDLVTATAKGTKMPRGDKQVIMNYPVPNFPLDTQKKIAAVLSALDDKIELNNAINKNLEEQAQAIFDNFFYDKWNNGNFSVSSLDKIAEYLNGLAMQKFRPKENETGLPVLKIRELRQGFCDKESDSCSERIKPEFIIHAGDVIFSWSGTLLIDFWCGGLCGLNQHLFKVTSKSYGKWFYYLWTKYHLKRFIKLANDMATTMGHIKRKALTDSKVLIPDRENYLRLEKILQPICDKIIANRLENKKLGELRDTLLPRLMSGEIDVSVVEEDL